MIVRPIHCILTACLCGCSSPTGDSPRASPSMSDNSPTPTPNDQGAEPTAFGPGAKIGSFQGEHRFLSNFWPAEVEFEGLVYPTVEHAYQSAKTLDRVERHRIAALPTPADAKRAGRALALRADWEHVKFELMESFVRQKFTRHDELRDKLLATGDAILEEGNTWGDRVWGVYQGAGENKLGKILMNVRRELREGSRFKTQSPEHPNHD